MHVKFITQPGELTSFRILSEKLCKGINMYTEHSCAVFSALELKPKTDVTILHEAYDILLNYKPNRENDGKIICMTVSDTDKISDFINSLLDMYCDVVTVPSEWSTKAIHVSKPLLVLPNPVESFNGGAEKRVGFYITLNPEQFHRKGSDLMLSMINRINYPIVIKEAPAQMPPYFVQFKFNKDITYLFKVDTMEEFYKRIQILVHLPRGGAFELPAWEAYCSGVVPIVTDHPIFNGLPAIRVKSSYVDHIYVPLNLMDRNMGGGYEADVLDAIEKLDYVWNNLDKVKAELFKDREKICSSLSLKAAVERLTKLFT